MVISILSKSIQSLKLGLWTTFERLEQGRIKTFKLSMDEFLINLATILMITGFFLFVWVVADYCSKQD